MDFDAAHDRHDVVAYASGAEYGNGRRHDDGRGIAACHHAEIGQSKGEILHILGCHRTVACGLLELIEVVAQPGGILGIDLAQDGHYQAIRRIDCHGQVNVFHALAAGRDRIEQGVEAGFGAHAGTNRTNDPHREIVFADPVVDIGIIQQRAVGDLIAGQSHTLRHGPTRAAQWFGCAHGDGGSGRRRVGRSLKIAYVVGRDQSVLAGSRHAGQIHAQPVGQSADCGRGLDPTAFASAAAAGDGSFYKDFVAGRHAANDGA